MPTPTARGCALLVVAALSGLSAWWHAAPALLWPLIAVVAWLAVAYALALERARAWHRAGCTLVSETTPCVEMALGASALVTARVTGAGPPWWTRVPVRWQPACPPALAMEPLVSPEDQGAGAVEVQERGGLSFRLRGHWIGRWMVPGVHLDYLCGAGVVRASLWCPWETFVEVRVPVLPRVGGRSASDGGAGTRARSRPAQAQEDLDRLRPWQSGDDVRQIAWKATARRGEVVVMERAPWQSTLRVLAVSASFDESALPQHRRLFDLVACRLVEEARLAHARGEATLLAWEGPPSQGWRCAVDRGADQKQERLLRQWLLVAGNPLLGQGGGDWEGLARGLGTLDGLDWSELLQRVGLRRFRSAMEQRRSALIRRAPRGWRRELRRGAMERVGALMAGLPASSVAIDAVGALQPDEDVGWAELGAILQAQEQPGVLQLFLDGDRVPTPAWGIALAGWQRTGWRVEVVRCVQAEVVVPGPVEVAQPLGWLARAERAAGGAGWRWPGVVTRELSAGPA